MIKEAKANHVGCKTVETGAIDQALTWLLLLILALVPLVIYLGFRDHVSPIITKTLLDTGKKPELFSYYKFIFLFFGTCILTILFLLKMIVTRYQVPPSYINSPLLALFLIILVSGVFAEYHTISILGKYNRFEGTLAYLMYLALFFISSNLIYSNARANWFVLALYPFTVINAVLGLINLYGINLLHTSLASFIIPSSIPMSNVEASSFVSSTLSNPDYISGTGGMLFSLFFSRSIMAETVKDKVVNISLTVFSLSMVLTSFATSGFFSLVTTLPLIFFMTLRSNNPKKGLITGAAILAACFLLIIPLSKQNPKVWNNSIGFFLGNRGNIISQAINPTGLQKNTGQNPSADDEFNLPPSAWGPGSGRLYIWKQSLGLIKSHPLLGYGMDTMLYYFPQDDPGKASQLYNPEIFVDKPHNWYLAIGFGSGVFAFAAFVALLLSHLWRNLKIIKMEVDSERRIILTSLFAAWVTYLVQAIFNDSTVGSGTIFWILFGVSVSLVKKEYSSNVIL